VVKLRKRGTGSNLVDMGRGAVRGHPRWMVDSVAGLACRWGGHGESLRRSRGDAAGAELGAKLIDRFAVNTGTIPHRSCGLESIRAGGIDASSVEGAGWGGGPVVVAGVTTRRGVRESRTQGEGGQQVGSESAGMPGGRW
jgi:hypothetical protein